MAVNQAHNLVSSIKSRVTEMEKTTGSAIVEPITFEKIEKYREFCLQNEQAEQLLYSLSSQPLHPEILMDLPFEKYIREAKELKNAGRHHMEIIEGWVSSVNALRPANTKA